jgi:hypothetical protein
MTAKIKTQFILSESNKIIFEIEGYLYQTKKNKLFHHDYMMDPKDYQVKKIEDKINSLVVCRKIYVDPYPKSKEKVYKKSTLKKS